MIHSLRASEIPSFFFPENSSTRDIRSEIFTAVRFSSNLSNAVTRTDDHGMIGDHCAINNDAFFLYASMFKNISHES